MNVKQPKKRSGKGLTEPIRVMTSNRYANILAFLLLASMFVLAVFSLRDDSATMDEKAYIPAGFSYLTQKDFRLDFEHPPLAKDLSAIPLLFFKINVPLEHISWTEQVNGQWDFGEEFLYHSGNNPDKILFWARIPMVILLVFLGWFLFKWSKELAGAKIALLVLTLFAFSPDFLAHGRLATIDLVNVLGVVLAIYFYLNFLKNPTRKNTILAGTVLAIALLVKFSSLILIPFFVLITLVWIVLAKEKYLEKVKKYGVALILMGAITIFFIWLVYQFHILNYSVERQLKDTQFILYYYNGPEILEKLCLWMANKPGFRPLGHYLLGLIMTIERTRACFSATYFWGKISKCGWWYYFPTVYFLKLPLAFHVLTLIVLVILFWKLRELSPSSIKQYIRKWIPEHFTEFSMILFVVIYWLVSLRAKINIGLRYLLPAFPFTYILICSGLKNLINNLKPSTQKIAIFFIFILIGWYIASSLFVFPHYLSYFNELIGGSKNGYKYVVDSNYDWGQDLKRLRKWVDSQKIERIYVDYFGGGDIEYYLGDRAIPFYGSSWWAYWGKMQKPQDLPKGNYLAVSATFLQGGWGDEPKKDYTWLDDYTPIGRAGNSIFIYYIP